MSAVNWKRPDKAGKRLRNEFQTMLSKAHPATFVEHSLRRGGMPPLKIGIFEDLKAAYPDVPDEVVQAVLVRYTGSSWYLRGLQAAGAVRVDLNGVVVEDVTAEARELARTRLEAKLARRGASSPAKPS